MENEPKLTHVDAAGKPTMVDVSDKTVTQRTAVAGCTVRVPEAVQSAFDGTDIQAKKGPVFHTAIIAGTMAVKKTSDLIPFCHPMPIDGCSIDIAMSGDTIEIRCTVRVEHKTGVEMEALTGATVAALTVYDMCKALSHEIRIEDVALIGKRGGKRDVGDV